MKRVLILGSTGSIGTQALEIVAASEELQAIDHLLIRAFLGQLYERGLSKASVARSLSSIRSFFKWMGRERKIDSNPALLVAAPKLPKKLPRVPTMEEMNAVLDAKMPEEASFAARDRLILELLYGCGLRNSELVGINLADIHWSNGAILVRGKGKKQRLVPFGESASAALSVYLPQREKALKQQKRSCPALLVNRRGGRLTTRSVGRIVKRFAVDRGLAPDVHPHTLRHAPITAALDAGVPLRDVQEAASHADPRTTMRYDRARGSLDRHATYIVAASALEPPGKN